MERFKQYFSLYLLLVLTLAISCRRSQPHIEGDLLNLPDGMVYLSRYGETGLGDSTLSVTGKFNFKVPDSLADLYFISFEADPAVTIPVFAGNGNVLISGNFSSLNQISVIGPKDNELFRNFMEHTSMTNVLKGAVEKELDAYRDSTVISDSLRLHSLLIKRDSLDRVERMLEEDFIRDHPSSIMHAVILNSRIDRVSSAEQLDSMIRLLEQEVPPNAFTERIREKRALLP